MRLQVIMMMILIINPIDENESSLRTCMDEPNNAIFGKKNIIR
jgi:hypothetical protein